MYDVFVEKSRKLGGLSAAWQGAGMGVFFFIIYSAYALGMYSKASFLMELLTEALAFTFGATLINEGHADAYVILKWVLSYVLI